MRNTIYDLMLLLVLLFVPGLVILDDYQLESKLEHGSTGHVQVCVKAGDNLWSLATPYAPAWAPLNRYIYHVEKLNGTQNKFLHPGDVIIIPLYENE